MLNRILSAIGLEKRSTIGVNGWPVPLSATAVTPESAQGVGACYAAVALIAEAIGSLPLKLYRQDGDDRKAATEHPLHTVLHRAPNGQQSATEFWEWMVSSMLLTGNAYAKVTRGFDGQVRSLDPMVTDRVTIMRKGETIAGYEYTNRDGVRERLLPAEVFHLRHRAGNDPLVGVSPIAAARAVIQLAQAEAQHGQSTFDNGTKASGIITMPGRLKPEQRQAIAQSWQSQYAGGSNAGKVPIMEEGSSFVPISLSLADSEWVASRRFSVEEVARIFKVPPVLIGDLSHSTYSNSVAMDMFFAKHTLGRHLSAIEGAINRQLLTPAAARTMYAEFSLEGLLRGASTERAAFYSSGISDGWMLKSEARKLENLPAIEGLDDEKEGGHSVPTPAPLPYPSKQQEAMA
ncbi:phage portal protein [Diaphorobacter sp. C33]|uniref:HK97 family phage portal protein n=1 Tax=Diaphorobacter nitroreducens TaxID=164759 RepID=A0AAX1WVF9_9BURK|nr:phage portal protein [Diaphorobacter sp. C33]ROR47976.1 HK97 family phage portal protein [Diaphorobacter nitroreducens]WKK90952.1 phage portal protein [Diaphorobacter sp. C33]